MAQRSGGDAPRPPMKGSNDPNDRRIDPPPTASRSRPHGADEEGAALKGAGHDAIEEDDDPRGGWGDDAGRRRPVDSVRHGCAAGEHGATSTLVVMEDRIHRRVSASVIDDAL